MMMIEDRGTYINEYIIYIENQVKMQDRDLAITAMHDYYLTKYLLRAELNLSL